MPERGSNILPWLAIAAFVALCDQWSKAAVVANFARGEALPLTSFFNLTLTYNRGAAFSLFADQDGWQRGLFIAIAIIASAVIVYLLRKYAGEKLFCAALALILGGALGNLWDRVMLGEVVDFLDFHWQGRHFPAFNLADSAITLGAGLLIFDSFRPKKSG